VSLVKECYMVLQETTNLRGGHLGNQISINIRFSGHYVSRKSSWTFASISSKERYYLHSQAIPVI
jgi:hypothetical protein